MRLRRLLPLLALAMPLAGAADPNRVPDATPTGKPQSCIPLYAIRNTEVRSDRVIDFITSGGRAYRNVLPQDCPTLGFEERFSYETSLSQLCSTDIITVLYTSPVSRGPSCGLGTFQPVTLTKR